MLLWITEWLARDVRAFNVFGYLTLRAVLACMTALVISFVIGPRMIDWLTRMKIGQAVRDDGPQTHLAKAGTPTMGGALILVAILVTTLLWGDLENRFVWVVLIVTAGFGAIGWVDDYRKVVYRNPRGLSARAKLAWQSAIGLVAAVFLAFSVAAPDNVQFARLFGEWVASGFSTGLPARADLIVPFFKTISYPLGVFGFIALTYFVIVGTSNAVNLTDGLDGLAIMPTVMIGAALGVFAYVSGNAVFARYLQFPYIPGSGEVAVICGAIAGAGKLLVNLQFVAGLGLLGNEVNNALDFLVGDERALGADQLGRAGRQIEQIAFAEELVGAHRIEDGAGVHLGRDLERDTGGDVRLDDAGDDIHARALGGDDAMDARGPGHLGDAGDGHFHIRRRDEHQVGQLVNDDHDVAELLGDDDVFLARDHDFFVHFHGESVRARLHLFLLGHE